ncbi:hypothetical protein A0H81_08522 [Grifola frondosa]|uniref:Uncharacterized protein n=1 Tax=Grifola frondosa TaxID=5627 RepID=A0A1C7M4V1_GRIFR|nr:hypothetical protein A0H81_08522 [Grifola frondosa]
MEVCVRDKYQGCCGVVSPLGKFCPAHLKRSLNFLWPPLLVSAAFCRYVTPVTPGMKHNDHMLREPIS